MSYWALWLVITILLFLIETTTHNLVSIWFVISGLVTLITSLFMPNLIIQLAVFLILGILLLLLLKKKLKKYLDTKKLKESLNQVLGMEGIVTKTILKDQVGEVEIESKVWPAISKQKIIKDSRIKAVAIARGFVAPSGDNLVVIPAFSDIVINGEDKTAMKLIVTKK